MVTKTIILLIIFILIVLPIHTWSTEAILSYGNIFDFGSVSTDSEIKHTFIISQKVHYPLHIKNAYSSCDNLHILSYPQEILPHENGQLKVRFIPTEPGEITCNIALETENAPTDPLLYRLKGKIIGKTLQKGEKYKLMEISAKMITRKLKKRDPAFFISVKSVLEELQEKRDMVLIDVRNSGEFEKFRIPGSINMPLFSIKSKNFLKPKPLVIFNEGYNYTQLEKECKRLRESGFSVSIMEGGLHHWKWKNGPLQGDEFAQKELDKISPQIFFTEKDYDHWIIIYSSQSKRSESHYLIPQGICIPILDDSEQFVSKLRTELGKHVNDYPHYVLILDDNGDQYEKIEKHVHKAGIKNVFYLKGGLEGYKSYIEQQVSIQQGRNDKKERVKTLKKCTSCP